MACTQEVLRRGIYGVRRRSSLWGAGSGYPGWLLALGVGGRDTMVGSSSWGQGEGGWLRGVGCESPLGHLGLRV